MSSTEDYYCRLLFENRVCRASGDEFQRLFSDVMGYADSRFQPIIPWGSWGDGGNDGWIPEDGHYFQVYGPKPTTNVSETEAVKKAIEDFDKLPAKWQGVRRYSFVMNDRFTGIPGPIDSALQKLAKDKGLESAKGFAMKTLMGHFMDLQLDKRQHIIGGIPSATVSFVDYRAVGSLLSALADKANSVVSFLNDKAPDFDQKIVFNGLTPPISLRLRVLSYQVSVVDDFLTNRDSGLRQAIGQEIHQYYQESTTYIHDDVSEAANKRYIWMIEKLIPDSLPKHEHSLAAYRQAAEMVIAKYFETCDVYEHPNGPAAA